MKWMFALAAIMTVIAAPLGHAQTSPAQQPSLDPSLERCIRENAPKVERAVADLSEGVTFLTQNICAAQAAALQTRDFQARINAMRDAARQQCEASRAATASQHPTDANEVSACQMSSAYDTTSAWSGTMIGPVQSPPQATALAAQLLLDQRLAHGAR